VRDAGVKIMDDAAVGRRERSCVAGEALQRRTDLVLVDHGTKFDMGTTASMCVPLSVYLDCDGSIEGILDWWLRSRRAGHCVPAGCTKGERVSSASQ
jgi:hypothetical protein